MIICTIDKQPEKHCTTFTFVILVVTIILIHTVTANKGSDSEFLGCNVKTNVSHEGHYIE